MISPGPPVSDQLHFIQNFQWQIKLTCLLSGYQVEEVQILHYKEQIIVLNLFKVNTVVLNAFKVNTKNTNLLYTKRLTLTLKAPGQYPSVE